MLLCAWTPRVWPPTRPWRRTSCLQGITSCKRHEVCHAAPLRGCAERAPSPRGSTGRISHLSHSFSSVQARGAPCVSAVSRTSASARPTSTVANTSAGLRTSSRTSPATSRGSCAAGVEPWARFAGGRGWKPSRQGPLEVARPACCGHLCAARAAPYDRHETSPSRHRIPCRGGTPRLCDEKAWHICTLQGATALL